MRSARTDSQSLTATGSCSHRNPEPGSRSPATHSSPPQSRSTRTSRHEVGCPDTDGRVVKTPAPGADLPRSHGNRLGTRQLDGVGLEANLVDQRQRLGLSGAAGGPQGKTPWCRTGNSGDFRGNQCACWRSDPRRETLSLSHGMALGSGSRTSCRTYQRNSRLTSISFERLKIGRSAVRPRPWPPENRRSQACATATGQRSRRPLTAIVDSNRRTSSSESPPGSPGNAEMFAAGVRTIFAEP